MSLRTRTVAVVALVALAAGVLVVLISRAVVLGDFASLEADDARVDAERAASAVEHDVAALVTVVADWAVWDDTYDYVQSHSEAYEDSNLGAVTLEGLNLDVFAIADETGHVLWDGMLGTDGLEPVPAGLHRAVAPGGALHTAGAADDGRAGLLDVDGNLLLVAAHAVTDSQEVAEPRGVLVMGQWLDDDAIASLATRLQLDVALEAPAATGAVGRTNGSITATTPLHDVLDQPVATMTVTQPRDLMARGVASVRVLVSALVITLLVAGIVLALGVDRLVVRPLGRLRADVEDVIADGGTGRVSTGGSGEIRDLAHRTNDMLAALERARQDLELRNHELEDANAVKDDLVSVVSHEFKTPLTVILGFAGTLAEHDGRLSPEQRADFVDRITGQADRLSRLVDDLLVLSRADRGELQPQPEPTGLRDVVEEVVADLGMEASVVLDIEPDVHAIVDPDHLRRLFVNLLDNARKYGTPPATVTAEVAGDTVRIEVGDAGAGVPDDFVHHLFHRFTQADHADRRVQGGTGLGLSIVRDLCTANSGTVSYSAGPAGHAFVMVLPGQRMATGATGAPAAPTTGSGVADNRNA